MGSGELHIDSSTLTGLWLINDSHLTNEASALIRIMDYDDIPFEIVLGATYEGDGTIEIQKE